MVKRVLFYLFFHLLTYNSYIFTTNRIYTKFLYNNIINTNNIPEPIILYNEFISNSTISSTVDNEDASFDYYDILPSLINNLNDYSKERCILVAVESKGNQKIYRERFDKVEPLTLRESLKELKELVKTAGLNVVGLVVQRLQSPHSQTYIGTGKVNDIAIIMDKTNARTLIFDDDLTQKQQRNIESLFDAHPIATKLININKLDIYDNTIDTSTEKSKLINNLNYESNNRVKILDRTAIILEIFAQRAKSKEGQLQVELALLEYRLTRGPKATGSGDSGAGFRGPGESRIETDKRIIKDKILLVKKEIEKLQIQRLQNRKTRTVSSNPIITLVGYTNAGKSTLMNKLSQANVLAEDKLFATLDPTTRKVKLPNIIDSSNESNGKLSNNIDVFLTDTVGFISKLPTSLIAAFRSTLEEINQADVLVHVIDRSNPVWRKHRIAVLKELQAIGCVDTPLVELWNKIDQLDNPEEICYEAMTLPIETEGYDDETIDEDVDMLPDSIEIIDENIDNNTNEYIINDNDTNNNENDVDDNYITEDVDSLIDRKIDEPTPTYKFAEKLTNSNFNTQKNKQPRKNTFVVAASVKTGLGMNDFLLTLKDAISLNYKHIEVEIPYQLDNGIVASIHSSGIIESISYNDLGTQIQAKVPPSLHTKLQRFAKYN